MGWKELNHKALGELKKQNFYIAQRLFQANVAKYPSGYTYHNLGVFLYENGYETFIHKTFSGQLIGKYYVMKAFNCFSNFQNCFLLGEINYTEKQYDKAIECYNKGITMAEYDNKQVILNNLGASWFCYGKWKEAIAAYSKAMSYEKDSPCIPLIVNMIHGLIKANEIARAQALYQKYCKFFDMDDQFLFGYLLCDYDSAYKCMLLLSDFDPDLTMFSMMMNCAERFGDEKLQKLLIDSKRSLIDNIAYAKRKLSKEFDLIIKSPQARYQKIENYIYRPITLKICNYINCECHVD